MNIYESKSVLVLLNLYFNKTFISDKKMENSLQIIYQKRDKTGLCKLDLPLGSLCACNQHIKISHD